MGTKHLSPLRDYVIRQDYLGQDSQPAVSLSRTWLKRTEAL